MKQLAAALMLSTVAATTMAPSAAGSHEGPLGLEPHLPDDAEELEALLADLLGEGPPPSCCSVNCLAGGCDICCDRHKSILCTCLLGVVPLCRCA